MKGEVQPLASSGSLEGSENGLWIDCMFLNGLVFGWSSFINVFFLPLFRVFTPTQPTSLDVSHAETTFRPTVKRCKRQRVAGPAVHHLERNLDESNSGQVSNFRRTRLYLHSYTPTAAAHYSLMSPM